MNLQEHLAKIRAFYRSHKRMPSYSELMAVVGFRSKNAASVVENDTKGLSPLV